MFYSGGVAGMSRNEEPVVQSSTTFYDALAADYDALFDAPHRRAYDDLTWEFVQPLLPATPGRIVDAGCANGRWSQGLVALGHHVIGIEQSPAMAAAARRRLGTASFTLLEGSMDEVDLPEGQADLVLALGSLQYTRDPEYTLERFARWLRPGGMIVVLVDSLVALVLELVTAGKQHEAVIRLETHMATWVQGEQQVDYHLMDRDRLERGLQRAGFSDVVTRGLLVGASALGRKGLLEHLVTARDEHMALERQLAANRLLADLGKQLFATGCRAD